MYHPNGFCTDVSICVTNSVKIVFGGGTRLTVQPSKRIIYFNQRTLIMLRNCLDWVFKNRVR